MIPHTFDENTHIYHVEGEYVLSTSDVIELAHFSVMDAIPKQVLENAIARGNALHKAVQFHNEEWLNPEVVPEQARPYFNGALQFMRDFKYQPIGKQEVSIVYEHEHGQLVGCTIDSRGLINGKPYIVDWKSNYQYSGAALKQKLLEWRMRLQSYVEATQSDELWWREVRSHYQLADGGAGLGRIICHAHDDGTYTPYDFSAFTDDSENWASFVHTAMLKIKNGFKPSNRIKKRKSIFEKVEESCQT